MDYFWLIPFVIVLIVLIWAFYRIVIRQGAGGVPSEGETLVDKTGDAGKNPHERQ